MFQELFYEPILEDDFYEDLHFYLYLEENMGQFDMGVDFTPERSSIPLLADWSVEVPDPGCHSNDFSINYDFSYDQQVNALSQDMFFPYYELTPDSSCHFTNDSLWFMSEYTINSLSQSLSDFNSSS